MTKDWIAENPIVTLDFDGCIAIGNHLKIKCAKEIDNVDITLDQCSRERYPLGPQRYLELMDIVGTEYILEYKLDPQCKQVLTNLFNQGFRFAIVTSREKGLLKACKKFIEYHKLPISYVHGTGKKSGSYIPKDVYVSKLKSRAMIDDTLYKLIQLKDTPVQLFFLKRPWSEHELSKIDSNTRDRITIINDWSEFESGLLYMKELHEAICYYQEWKNNWRFAKDIFNFWKANPKVCEKYFQNYRKEIRAA